MQSIESVAAAEAVLDSMGLLLNSYRCGRCLVVNVCGNVGVGTAGLLSARLRAAMDGYLVLIVLRYAEEVVDSSALPRPEGRPLLAKEIAMGEQLVEALAGEFDPSQFRDEYRDRVMDLIRTKERGGKVKVTKFRPKKTGDDALTGALAASLSGLRKKSA